MGREQNYSKKIKPLVDWLGPTLASSEILFGFNLFLVLLLTPHLPTPLYSVLSLRPFAEALVRALWSWILQWESLWSSG